MLFGALLHSRCKAEVADVLEGHELIDAGSWKDLDDIARKETICGVLADPSVDRIQGITGATRFLHDHPQLPTIGFFDLSAANLHAALLLARQGLCEAYTYPLAARQRHFKRMVETLAAPHPVALFLELIEPSFGRLPPLTGASVRDLFNRPHRYSSSTDLALECRTSIRHLYRQLESAMLASPKKLVVAAKMLRALHYLIDRRLTVHETSALLGYENTRAFAKHTNTVLACAPSNVRSRTNRDEMVIDVIDWVFKPARIDGEIMEAC